MKNIFKVALLSLIAMCSARAVLHGVEEVKAVFAAEMQCVENMQKSLINIGNLSVMVDSPIVSFIRANHEQFAHDIDVFIDVMMIAYRQSTVQKAFADVGHALQALIMDKGLARATSGKDIVALASYQNFKAADKACKNLLQRLHKAAAEKMPVLYACLNVAQLYYDTLMEERVDKALSCLEWGEPLGDLVSRLRDSDWQVDNICLQLEEALSAVQYALSDESLARIATIAVPTKAFFRAVCGCFGSEVIMNQLRSLKVSDKIEDQNMNAVRLAALLSDSTVQELVRATQEFTQALPAISLAQADSLDDDVSDDCEECGC